MPFEIQDANGDGDPLILFQWDEETPLWPGDPARWKGARPGLLNFLDTVRLDTELSLTRAGYRGDLLYEEDRDGDVLVQIADVMLLHRDGTFLLDGSFCIPICMYRFMEGRFLDLLRDAGLQDCWRENGSLVRELRDALSEHVGVVGECAAVSALGIRKPFGLRESVNLAAPTLANVMIMAAQECQQWYARLPDIIGQLRNDEPTLRLEISAILGRHQREEQMPRFNREYNTLELVAQVGGSCWPGSPREWNVTYGADALRMIRQTTHGADYTLAAIRHGSYLRRQRGNTSPDAVLAHAMWCTWRGARIQYGYMLPIRTTAGTVAAGVNCPVAPTPAVASIFGGCRYGVCGYTDWAPSRGWESALIRGARLYADAVYPHMRRLFGGEGLMQQHELLPHALFPWANSEQAPVEEPAQLVGEPPL